MLETVKLRTNPAQRQTIEKLIEMNDSYQEFLKQNIKEAQNGNPTEQTLSVSRFIGSSEFRGDPKEYEAFKLFGTFMHEVLELAQDEAIAKNKTYIAGRAETNKYDDEDTTPTAMIQPRRVRR